MTTEKLKIIAPEWVVANGIIRPVNPWSRKRAMELASLTLQRKFNEFMTVVKQHTYATDLPDGPYSAEGLKVVWETKHTSESEWVPVSVRDMEIYGNDYNQFVDDLSEGFKSRIKWQQHEKANHSIPKR